MSFAEQWAKDFSNEYKLQKMDDWWDKLRKPSSTAWTYRIAEFLRNLAQKMGYQMEYEIATDFSWYREGSTFPSIAIEHENTYSEDIYNDELQKLLASNASLKVLITYVEKRDEETELINRFKKVHRKRVHEPVSKQINEEFLFIIEYSWESANWRYYIFYPTGKLKKIKWGKDKVLSVEES